MSLDKRKELKAKKKTLKESLQNIVETKTHWESLSVKNRHALSSSLSVEQPLARGSSDRGREIERLQVPNLETRPKST